MIYTEHSSDFELSLQKEKKGAVQGYGYEPHEDGSTNGPRILRLYDASDFSVHDITLVDAPTFHFSMDTCDSGEVCNTPIHGGSDGGLDGIDVRNTNIWLHDIMVTNKDECVTVKSPSSNVPVERVYCNWSGGCAMGSLGADVDVSNVTYRNVYTYASNEMYMITSNSGSETVENVVLENFIGHGNAYSFDIDHYWPSIYPLGGDGVQLLGITISTWTGIEANGAARGPIQVLCADGAPCTDITISDFAIWIESGDTQWYARQSAWTSDIDTEEVLLARRHRGEVVCCYHFYCHECADRIFGSDGATAPTISDNLTTGTWNATAEIPNSDSPVQLLPWPTAYL